MTKTKSAIAAACLILVTEICHAKTIRATELNGASLTHLTKNLQGDLIIEFRQGDELAVNLSADGDLMETTRAATSYIGIKRNFWLKMEQSKIQISFDGTNFKEMSEALSGSIEAGAGSDQNGGIANAINIAFKAFLK